MLVYTTLGGLTSAIYNELLQFFIIVAALLPLTLVALHSIGGWSGLENKVRADPKLGEPGLHAWHGLAIHHVTNPLASDRVGIVFGLGFVLSFGYWTTTFRRGPARPVGEQHLRLTTHTADRRLPEDLPARDHHRPRDHRRAHRQGAGRHELMLFWALSRPTVPEPEETRGQGSGRIRRAAAT